MAKYKIGDLVSGLAVGLSGEVVSGNVIAVAEETKKCDATYILQCITAEGDEERWMIFETDSNRVVVAN